MTRTDKLILVPLATFVTIGCLILIAYIRSTDIFGAIEAADHLELARPLTNAAADSNARDTLARTRLKRARQHASSKVAELLPHLGAEQ